MKGVCPVCGSSTCPLRIKDFFKKDKKINMEIIINGVKRNLPKRMTYDDLVKFSCFPIMPKSTDGFTITYENPDKIGGSIVKGEVLTVIDGTIINVINTSNS